MAFDINSAYTLPEVLRAKAPDGSHMVAVDVLSMPLPLIEEGYWVQANDDTSHEFLRTSYEPTGTLVRLNEGAPYEAGTTVPVKEQIARLESNLRIDTRILKKAPDPVAYRREREAMHFRGMVKTFEKIMFNPAAATGDQTVNPKTVNGLWKRYGTLASGKVVSNGGSGGASIWAIKWGPEGAFFIYPKTASKTIEINDMREQKNYDANGYPYYAVETNFGWEFGLGVADERAVKRLCNIAASGNNSFFEDSTKASKGEEALIDLIESLPGGSTDGVALYAGPTVVAQMRKRLMNRSNIYFSTETIWGRPMLTFQGLPVIRVDNLTADEPTVS